MKNFYCGSFLFKFCLFRPLSAIDTLSGFPGQNFNIIAGWRGWGFCFEDDTETGD